MSTSSVRADGVRPPGAPSYIEARQRADRHSRVRARLLIVVALVHVAYLIVPILPCAALWVLLGSVVMAMLTIIIATMASSFGQGRVTGTALESIAEQPAARDALSTTLFISLALLESLALYALIVALILLFANPVVDRVLPR